MDGRRNCVARFVSRYSIQISADAWRSSRSMTVIRARPGPSGCQLACRFRGCDGTVSPLTNQSCGRLSPPASGASGRRFPFRSSAMRPPSNGDDRGAGSRRIAGRIAGVAETLQRRRHRGYVALVEHGFDRNRAGPGLFAEICYDPVALVWRHLPAQVSVPDLLNEIPIIDAQQRESRLVDSYRRQWHAVAADAGQHIGAAAETKHRFSFRYREIDNGILDEPPLVLGGHAGQHRHRIAPSELEARDAQPIAVRHRPVARPPCGGRFVRIGGQHSVRFSDPGALERERRRRIRSVSDCPVAALSIGGIARSRPTKIARRLPIRAPGSAAIPHSSPPWR